MQINIIIPDGYIEINGEALLGFDLSEYYELKAIHSIDGKTHVLKMNGDGSFDDNFQLKPFVDMFNLKKQEIEDARIAWENSPERFKAYISQYRRKREQGGLTINGVTVQTDTESRANLLGAAQLGTAINWKTPDGFVELTGQQISDIATAVGVHVQKCFSAEKTVLETHTQTPYDSIEAIETAFDNAYNS